MVEEASFIISTNTASTRTYGCEEDQRHCEDLTEKNTDSTSNVFMRPGEIIPCESDINGNYNFNYNNVNETLSLPKIIVNFEYEIQTTIEQTVWRLSSDVDNEPSALRSIEKALSDILVANLFGNKQSCSDNNSNNQQTTLYLPIMGNRISSSSNENYGQKQQHGKDRYHSRTLQEQDDEEQLSQLLKGSLSGLLAEPADQIVPGTDGILCRTELLDQADRCYIIGGSFTLIKVATSDDDINNNNSNEIDIWSSAESIRITKDAMDTGRLDMAHPDIYQVRFVSSEPFYVPRGKIEGEDDNSDNNIRDGGIGNDDDNNGLVAWIVLGVGVFVFLVIIVIMFKIARRRQQKRKRDEQIDSFQTTTYSNV